MENKTDTMDLELKLFPKHTGIWVGTYTRLDPEGKIVDQHKSRLSLRLDGNKWTQVNEYTWADGKNEVHDFGESYFDEKGILYFDNQRIRGEAWEADQVIVLTWTYKEEPGSGLYEIITLLDDSHRMRTWQHSKNGKFDGLTMISEEKIQDQDE